METVNNYTTQLLDMLKAQTPETISQYLNLFFYEQIVLLGFSAFILLVLLFAVLFIIHVFRKIPGEDNDDSSAVLSVISVLWLVAFVVCLGVGVRAGYNIMKVKTAPNIEAIRKGKRGMELWKTIPRFLLSLA